MLLILRWIIAAVALWVTLQIVAVLDPSHTRVAAKDRPVMMLITVLVLGFANAVIGPLLKLLTLPLNCLTFGLFSFVINAALFWAVGQFYADFRPVEDEEVVELLGPFAPAPGRASRSSVHEA